MEPSRVRAGVSGGVILAGMISAGLLVGSVASNRGARDAAPPVRNLREVPRHEAVATPRSMCGEPGVVSPRTTRSGGSIALAPDEQHGAVVDTDNDAVELIELSSSTVRAAGTLRVGRAPAQVLLGSDGRVFVSERGANAVSVYDAAHHTRLCTAHVAVDPYGLALAPDERTLYVTSGISHTVTAIDTCTFEPRFATEAGREPRGIAVSADGRVAFVSHLAGEPMTALDLDGATVRARTLPNVPVPTDSFARMMGLVAVSGIGMPAAPPVGGARPIPSQAWTLVMDDARQSVLVPFMVNRTGRDVPAAARLDVYGAGSVDPESAEKVTFAVARFDFEHNRWAEVTVLGSRAFTAPTATAGSFATPPSSVHGVRIPIAAALRSTDGALVVASLGTGTLVASGGHALPVHDAPSELELRRRGMRIGPVTTTPPPPSAANVLASVPSPTGVAVTRDGIAIVYAAFDHAVSVVGHGTPTRVVLASDPLPADVARGRRLFYTANDPELSSGGLSCGGCHPDGRDDGLTWFLQRGPRQTPTLAGRLAAPFNWNGSAATMEENIAQTVHRLGGTGLRMSQIDDLTAYLQRGVAVPYREPHSLSALEERGRQLFTTVGNCATCHDAQRNFTDGQVHEFAGIGPDETVRTFDTPSLRFVAGTAPYFHDGRYATLEQVLADRTPHMGRNDLFSPDDATAVAAYLRTL